MVVDGGEVVVLHQDLVYNGDLQPHRWRTVHPALLLRLRDLEVNVPKRGYIRMEFNVAKQLPVRVQPFSPSQERSVSVDLCYVEDGLKITSIVIGRLYDDTTEHCIRAWITTKRGKSTICETCPYQLACLGS